jgi:DNA-binding response OmpR family regulator
LRKKGARGLKGGVFKHSNTPLFRVLQSTGMSKKILIIEDVPQLADSLEDLLTFKGYVALKSRSGSEGLDIALTEKPDLILLDLRLPDIHGFDVLRKLRADEWGKTARVLILTASDVEDRVPKDISVPPEMILHKSLWGIDNLAARIEEEVGGL